MMRPIRDQCRPVTDRWRANYAGYFGSFRISITVVCLAAVADLVTTVLFMLEEGIEEELHPAFRLAARVLGPIIGPTVGKACQLLAILFVTVYWRPIARYIFLTVTIIYFWAAWYNVWGRHIYVPVLLEWLFPQLGA